jgi:hypothetical protein
MKLKRLPSLAVCALVLRAGLPASGQVLEDPGTMDNAPLSITGTETHVCKSFTAQPKGKLVADVESTDLEVVTADQNRVDIVLQRKVSGGTQAQAEELLKAHQVSLFRKDNEIHIQAHTGREIQWARLQARLRVTVPKQFAVALQSTSGDAALTGLQGQLDLRTDSGDLALKAIQGPVTVRTSSGDIRAKACADTFDLEADSGDLDLADFTGPSIRVRTSSGDISVKWAVPPKADSSLHATSGDITVKLPAASALNLDVATNSGDISASDSLAIARQGKVSENSLRGTLNGGGPLLSLRATSGDIHIQRR